MEYYHRNQATPQRPETINTRSVEEFELEDAQRCQKIKDNLHVLLVSEYTAGRMAQVFRTEMDLALNEKPSSLQMENTYIPELPDGTEEGVYLALDLGGTNFRMILMELLSSVVVREEVKHYHIPDSLRVGSGDVLFDYLAECVDNFVKEQKMTNDDIIMGFTFSFPMKQHSLDSGCLVTWTKSFNCPSIVDQDVVRKLRDSLEKFGRNNIQVLAILNDTTGTLVQGALLDRNTRIGIVLGTGTNACYMENADRVKHWEIQRHGEEHVIIDVEWGAFGDNGTIDFIKTEFDRVVDDGSLLKNSFTFEKYIAGKYLGELCRVIMESLADQGLFLLGTDLKRLPAPWTFGSDNVSLIEQDTLEGTDHRIKEILRKYKYTYLRDYTDDDIRILQYICGLISKRAGLFLAITTAALLERMAEEEITVAIDGSVYKHHSRLRQWLHYYTKKFVPHKKCKFLLTEDGSGKGAALVAAIAKKLLRHRTNN